MPPTDIECGLALARTPPNEQDWNLLVAWPWCLSPSSRSEARQALMLEVPTSVKSLCLILHLQNEWVGFSQHFSTLEPNLENLSVSAHSLLVFYTMNPHCSDPTCVQLSIV